MNSSSEELHEMIESHRNKMIQVFESGANTATASPTILREHAEITIILSKLAEIETRNITNLTRRLCGLTWGLVAIAVVQVMIMLFEVFHHVP
jgi:hypothetical protein